MPQFVIHKIGFFYTDEAFSPVPVEEFKGSVVSVFSNLEVAKEAKIKADVVSLQNCSDWISSATDFFLYAEDYDAIFDKVESYYKSEFNLKIEDKHYFDLPKTMTDQQAQHLIELMYVTFHQIIEYPDDVIITIGDTDDPLAAEVGEF